MRLQESMIEKGTLLRIHEVGCEGGGLRLSLEGVLDHAGALALAARIAAAEREVRVVDFSLLPQISDLALGLLAHAFRDAPSIRIAGLRSHGRSILRAFGVAIPLVPEPLAA